MQFKIIYRADGKIGIGHAYAETAQEASDFIEESLSEVNSDVEIISVKMEGKNAKHTAEIPVEESV